MKWMPYHHPQSTIMCKQLLLLLLANEFWADEGSEEDKLIFFT
jgi:hypothetical protein